MLLLPASAIGDRYGRRDALLAGLGFFALASLAPVFFDSPLQIIAARAVAGIGAAFIMPATLSLLIILAVTLTAGSTRDELGGSVTQHDDGGVGAAAGDGRQDRPVDHP